MTDPAPALGAPSRQAPVTVLAPGRGWSALGLSEAWAYRELLWFLALRDISVRYKQTVLGGVWALVQPLTTVLIFSVFFGRVAKVPSDGVPYPVFSMAGLLVWNFFAGSLDRSSGGIVGQSNLITKVYFPRLIVPCSAALVAVPDMLLGIVVLCGFLLAYGTALSWGALLVPAILILAGLSALGFGLWISAFTVRYRDLRHAMGLIVQLWLYATPVIYPASLVTQRLESLGLPGWLYGLNPAAGFVTAVRALLFPGSPFPYAMLATSIGVSAVVLLSGAFVFRRIERTFADVI